MSRRQRGPSPSTTRASRLALNGRLASIERRLETADAYAESKAEALFAEEAEAMLLAHYVKVNEITEDDIDWGDDDD